MAIEFTPDEINAFNIISQQATSLQGQLAQVKGAQKAIIELLETKYHAKFNEQTGQLEPLE